MNNSSSKMNEAENRLKLEEQARLLAKAADLVSEISSQMSSKHPKGQYKGNKNSNQQQNQRGCKSLSHLNASGSKPKFNEKLKKKPVSQNQPNQSGLPSYNESIQQNSQMGGNHQTTPLFNMPLMNSFPLNYYTSNSGNQVPLGPNYFPPNPQQHYPVQQQVRPQHYPVQQQVRPQHYPVQHQFRPQQNYQAHHQQQQFGAKQQYRPRQQFGPQHRQQFGSQHQQQFKPQPKQSKAQQQQQQQQSEKKTTNNIQYPKPLPRKSLQQNKLTPNVEQPDSSEKGTTNSSKSSIDLNNLVRELSNFNGFFTYVETLSKILERNYDDVLCIIKSKPKIFSTLPDEARSKVLVELCPNIKLCQDHMGALGCTKQKCLSLHICLNFINEKCQDKSCSFGHIWKTDHNNPVLKEYFLNLLPNDILRDLMKKVADKFVIPEICFDYHQSECDGDKCNKLHICYSYVNNLGNCNNGTDCSYNHNIRDPKCMEIFKNFGISTNESPRDLLKVLKDRCLSGKGFNKLSEGLVKAIEVNSTDKNMNVSSNSSDKIATDKDKKMTNQNKTKMKTQNLDNVGKRQHDQNKTIICWQFLGNVVEAKICIEGIYMKCKFISSGCKYLHCKHKSHWQFGKDDMWYNFHLFHSQILDTKYSDVNCDNLILPKLNPKKVTGQQNALFNLMGFQNCKVDFTTMTMDCEGSKKIFSIRHLTTKSSAICTDSESTEFKWYFLENDGKWISYGNNDSSSGIIEKAYLQQPTGNYNFKSTTFTYLLDFSKMTQENVTTKKVRPIKRRPQISQNKNSPDKDKFEIPKHWDKMTEQDEYKMVMLSSGNIEYSEIRQILMLSLPMIDIVNIYRVQNTHLWKQFKNKQTELEKKYNDSFLNIQKLFHGIDSKYLNDICRDNLEFRLHDDAAADKPFGEGTYFYNSAGVAASNSKVDFMGNRTLLVAEVFIGKVATGSRGITRPPPNDSGVLFDTTTDKVESPTVFVKYNRQEYYPAYIVEFK